MHRVQGRADIPLDETGRSIAKATGKALLLRGIHFTSVYSSPLSRAKETAALAAPGAEIRTDSRLSELDFGSFEGQPTLEMNEDPDCIFRFFISDPFRYNEEVTELLQKDSSFQCETLSELLKRAESFVQEVITPLVLSEREETRVLISGHGALNRALLMAFAKNKDLHTFWGKGLQPNCGITRVKAYREASGQVRYEADKDAMIFYDPEEFNTPSNLFDKKP